MNYTTSLSHWRGDVVQEKSLAGQCSGTSSPGAVTSSYLEFSLFSWCWKDHPKSQYKMLGSPWSISGSLSFLASLWIFSPGMPARQSLPQNSVDSLLRALGREYLFGDRSVQITLLYSNLPLLSLMFTVCLIRTLLDRLALLHYGQVVWIVWLFISLSVQTLINVHSVWTRGWLYFAYFH